MGRAGERGIVVWEPVVVGGDLVVVVGEGDVDSVGFLVHAVVFVVVGVGGGC